MLTAPTAAPGSDDSVDAARARMLSAVHALQTQAVPIESAAGRTLAQNLVAARAQPPFRSSAMDGYALRAADVGTASLRVLGEAAAGRPYDGPPIDSAGAVRIFTGAVVPEGADLVVPQERARRAGETVLLDLPPGAPLRSHIRDAGVDFRAGDTLLTRGTRLSTRHVALIAAAGIASLDVTRQPRVAVLATGSEIVPPGTPAAPHQIFDSVGFGLGAMIAEWGGEPSRLASRPDDDAAIAGAVQAAIDTVDLLVIIGGASVGDYDVVKRSLAGLGLVVEVPRVAVRPGRPTWFGRVGARPVLGLPGNPAAAFVCAHLFLRPLLHALLGSDAPAARTMAVLDGRLGDGGPSESYLRAFMSGSEDARQRVRPFDDQDTSLVSVFAAANALIRRPAGAAPAASGAIVELLLLDRG